LEKVRIGKPFTGASPQGLDEMGKMLDCLKSNGKLETKYFLDTTVEVKTRRQQSKVIGL
jgi:hypothetical protein